MFCLSNLRILNLGLKKDKVNTMNRIFKLLKGSLTSIIEFSDQLLYQLKFRANLISINIICLRYMNGYLASYKNFDSLIKLIQ